MRALWHFGIDATYETKCSDFSSPRIALVAFSDEKQESSWRENNRRLSTRRPRHCARVMPTVDGCSKNTGKGRKPRGYKRLLWLRPLEVSPSDHQAPSREYAPGLACFPAVLKWIEKGYPCEILRQAIQEHEARAQGFRTVR
jgi:hypothetical protein